VLERRVDKIARRTTGRYAEGGATMQKLGASGSSEAVAMHMPTWFLQQRPLIERLHPTGSRPIA
jgi:hypothetical protein